MGVDLKEILYLAGQEKDNEALGTIIEQFRPAIGKYARWLNYDGADTDLIISLIEKIRNIDFSKKRFINDGQVVNYISNSIRNMSIDIYRKNEREKNYQQLLSELSQKFEVVKEIQKSVDELKSAVLK